jgi:hypothetical protein
MENYLKIENVKESYISVENRLKMVDVSTLWKKN